MSQNEPDWARYHQLDVAVLKTLADQSLLFLLISFTSHANIAVSKGEPLIYFDMLFFLALSLLII